MLSQKTLKGEVLKETRPVFCIADFAFHHSTYFSTQYKTLNNMLLKDKLFSKHCEIHRESHKFVREANGEVLLVSSVVNQQEGVFR